jgi:nucleotide-binding universal stress UspA family protein
MLKLLIAVDGSEPSRHAIEAAARLASEAPSTEALLVNVRELPIIYGEFPAFDYETIERAAAVHQDQLLDAALIQARACGLTQVSTLAVVGVPAPEIARSAADHAVHQIVMGTHGRNALAGLLLGSVAQRVVHLAAVPVLLVK